MLKNLLLTIFILLSIKIYSLNIKKEYEEQYMINLHTWLPDSFEELKKKNEKELYNLARKKYHYHTDRTNLYNEAELKEIEKFIDEEKLNKYFVEILNKEREKKGLNNNVKTNFSLVKAAKIRSIEIAENSEVSHERPNGKAFWTVFEEENKEFLNVSSFENALVVSMDSEAQMISEKFLAEYFFQLWKESPKHREAMMDSKIESIGLNFAFGFPSNKNLLVHSTYAILLVIRKN